jgi:hypothetical protein
VTLSLSIAAGQIARCWPLVGEPRRVWCEGSIWFHGDIAVDNLLASDGKLSAVIDFGTCGVGDPLATWSLPGPTKITRRSTHTSLPQT